MLPSSLFATDALKRAVAAANPELRLFAGPGIVPPRLPRIASSTPTLLNDAPARENAAANLFANGAEVERRANERVLRLAEQFGTKSGLRLRALEAK